MPIYASEGDRKDFTPAPAGVHQAVCVDVIDKGILEVTYNGETKQQHKVTLAWQIDESREDGQRFVVFKRYTLSLNEKATLRKDLESWRGRPFTPAELKKFDVETVIGANGLVNLQHNVSADKTYANVVAVMPLAKGMAKLAAVDYVREINRTETPVNGSSSAHGDITVDDIPF